MARAGYPSASLYPDADLHPGVPESLSLFEPPTETHRYRIAGRALIGQVELGLTLWRSAGVWHTSYTPTADQLADADPIYEGGRVHEVDADAVELLVAAGYGDRITVLEVQ
jgi:hypothetical protein